MKKKVKQINLLPKEYVEKEKIKKWKVGIAGLLAFEVFLFTGFIVLPTYGAKKYEEKVLNELENMKNDPKYNEVNEKLGALKLEEDEFDFWKQKYNALKKENKIHTEALDVLVGNLPLGVTINTLNFIDEESQVMSISGQSESKEQLLNYILFLEKSYRKAQVEFEILEDNPYGYNVKITFPIETEKEEKKSEETEEGQPEETEESEEAGGEE